MTMSLVPLRARSWAQRPRSARRELLLLVGAALLIALFLRSFVIQSFVIPSGSMEPILMVQDRILVSRLSYTFGEPQRGDLIVFDGRDSFVSTEPTRSGLSKVAGGLASFLGFSPSEQDFTKRVIGLPGDRVTCCTPEGELSVNGQALAEPYLAPGTSPSLTRFDIKVPPGRLWVMGDNRANSADSRAHLGDPGGGTVPQDRVIGRIVARYWPLDRAGIIGQTATMEARHD